MHAHRSQSLIYSSIKVSECENAVRLNTTFHIYHMGRLHINTFVGLARWLCCPMLPTMLLTVATNVVSNVANYVANNITQLAVSLLVSSETVVRELLNLSLTVNVTLNRCPCHAPPINGRQTLGHLSRLQETTVDILSRLALIFVVSCNILY